MFLGNFTRRLISTFAVAVVALVFTQFSTPAFANAEGQAIADRLVVLFTEYGAKDVRYGDAEHDAATDVTIISGFSFSNPDDKADFSFESIELASAEIQSDGAITADFLGAGNMLVVETNNEKRLSVASIIVQDVLFPLKDDIDPKNNAFIYRLASEIIIEDLLFEDNEEDKIFPIARIFVTRGPLVGDIPENMHFAFDNMIIAPEYIDDAEARGKLKTLGYSQLDLSVSSDWVWDSVSEEATVGPIRFSLAEMGALSFEMTMGNVTHELLMTLEDKDRLMEQAQLLTLVGAHYGFEDDSITDRIIALMADDSDLSPGTLIGIWVDLARKQLMDQDMPEDFIKMVIGALDYFLNNPGKIDIRANPEMSVPATQLMGSVMFGPAALVPLLNITVTSE